MKNILQTSIFVFFASISLAQVKTSDVIKTTIPTTTVKTTIPTTTKTTTPTTTTTTNTTIKTAPVVTSPTVKPSVVTSPVITAPVVTNPGVIKGSGTSSGTGGNSGGTSSPNTGNSTPTGTPTPPTPTNGNGGFNPNFDEVSNAVDKLINNDLVKSLFTRQKTQKIEGSLGPNITIQKNIRLLLKDKELKPFFDKINISEDVFDDKNPDAKVLYYLPSSYQIRFYEEKKEYSFNVYYKTADASEGRVIATAQLFPNLEERDIQIAEKILRKELKKDIQLLPLPLNSTPKVSFENFLSTNYNISEADISTHAPTDIFEPITVSWKMDANSANNLVNLLTNNLEIPGNVYFSPNASSDGFKQIPVPFKIKFNDAKTFGTIQYVTGEKSFDGTIKNTFEYPIIIESANILKEKGKSYEVQKFETKFQKIQPNASVKLKDILQNASDLKDITDDDVAQLWFNYSTKGCNECDLGIQEKLLKGTSNKLVKRIEIQVLTPIQATGANSFRMLIKSIQGDPRGQSEVILPMITIKDDNVTLNGGELFVLNNDQPNFQYKIIRIDKDASKTESEWISSNDLLLVIGEKTITDLIKK